MVFLDMCVYFLECLSVPDSEASFALKLKVWGADKAA